MTAPTRGSVRVRAIGNPAITPYDTRIEVFDGDEWIRLTGITHVGFEIGVKPNMFGTLSLTLLPTEVLLEQDRSHIVLRETETANGAGMAQNGADDLKGAEVTEQVAL